MWRKEDSDDGIVGTE